MKTKILAQVLLVMFACQARASDPIDLTFSLSLLPQVAEYVLDDDGHLIELHGLLTPPGSSPPEVKRLLAQSKGHCSGAE